MKAKVKIGIIGMGFGANVHLPVFSSMKDVEVYAILANDLTKLKSIANQYNISYYYNRFDDFLKLDLDAISIALPPLVSEQYCEKILDKDIPILIEKPLASTYKKAIKLYKKSKNKIAMIDFQFVEIEAFKVLYNIIKNKKYGNVKNVQVVWQVESWAQKNKKWSWKTDKDQGGGVLSLLAAHFFYLIEYYFGRTKEIFAKIDNSNTIEFSYNRDKAAEDLVFIYLKSYSNINISAVIGNSCPGGIGHRWEIITDQGTIILHNKTKDYMAGFELKFRNNNLKEKILFRDEVLNDIDGRIEPFKKIAERFIEAVKKRDTSLLYPNFNDALRVQNLISMVFLSSQKNKIINI